MTDNARTGLMWVARGLAAAGLVVGGLFTAPASAQVEPGPWTQHSPSYNLQERGCGQIDGLTFRLTCSDSSGEQRAERRYATYTGGTRQFEGLWRAT